MPQKTCRYKKQDGMVFWGTTGKQKKNWRSPDKLYAAKKRNYGNKIRFKGMLSLMATPIYGGS